jgi:hypothetical protein
MTDFRGRDQLHLDSEEERGGNDRDAPRRFLQRRHGRRESFGGVVELLGMGEVRDVGGGEGEEDVEECFLGGIPSVRSEGG